MFDYHTPDGFDEKNSSYPSYTLTDAVYPSKTTGANRRCHVLLPAGYTTEKCYPVLYLLHGIGGTEDEWLGGNPVEVVGNLVGKGEAEEMIVVIPNVRAAADDSVPEDVYGPINCSAFDNFINDLRDDLMPFIAANYSIKTGRENTALAGLSMGGRETLFISTRMSDTFGYFGAFSPAPGLLPMAMDPARFPGQIPVDALRPADGAPTPIFFMICYGEQDMIVQFCAAEYHKVLTEHGVEHLFYTMPGGHDFGVWKNGLYHFARAIFH